MFLPFMLAQGSMKKAMDLHSFGTQVGMNETFCCHIHYLLYWSTLSRQPKVQSLNKPFQPVTLNVLSIQCNETNHSNILQVLSTHILHSKSILNQLQ